MPMSTHVRAAGGAGRDPALDAFRGMAFALICGCFFILVSICSCWATNLQQLAMDQSNQPRALIVEFLPYMHSPSRPVFEEHQAHSTIHPTSHWFVVLPVTPPYYFSNALMVTCQPCSLTIKNTLKKVFTSVAFDEKQRCMDDMHACHVHECIWGKRPVGVNWIKSPYVYDVT